MRRSSRSDVNRNGLEKVQKTRRKLKRKKMKMIKKESEKVWQTQLKSARERRKKGAKIA